MNNSQCGWCWPTAKRKFPVLMQKAIIGNVQDPFRIIAEATLAIGCLAHVRVIC